MKIINLAELSRNLSKERPRRTLSEVIREIEHGKASLNPFTLAAQKIVRKISDQYIFPFLSPKVVNPFEFENTIGLGRRDGGITRFFRGERFGEKFPVIQYSSSFGMNMPYGLIMSRNEFSNPHFVSIEDTSTEKAVLEYPVYDISSLEKFVGDIARDIASLSPIDRKVAFKQLSMHSNYIPEKGDIVLIPGQRYGKLGIVAEKVRKDYLAVLKTTDGFHNRHIGVDSSEFGTEMEELEQRIQHSEDNEFEETEETPRVSKSGSISMVTAQRLAELTRLPIGISAILRGNSNYAKKQERRWDEVDDGKSALGLVTITGYDTDCAIVLPNTFDPNEKMPWGSLKSMAIPNSELIYIGSINNTGSVLQENNFFVDNVMAVQNTRNTIQEVLSDNMLGSLASFSSLRRYSRLLDELCANPSIPPNLVSSQFISILTASNLEGLENLARISGQDPVETAIGLLQRDYEGVEWLVDSGRNKYRKVIESVDGLVAKNTKFKNLSDLLVNVSPQIGLYSIPRDGTTTLALIDGMQVISLTRSKKEYRKSLRGEREDEDGLMDDMVEELAAHGKHNASDVKLKNYFDKSHRLLDDKEIADFMSENWNSIKINRRKGRIFKRDDIPDNKFRENHFFDSYCLSGIYIDIPLKNNSIRYGRNNQFEMEYPELTELETDFRYGNITSSSEMHFLNRVMARVQLHTDFEGRKALVKDYKLWHKEFTNPTKRSEEDDDDDDRYIFGGRNSNSTHLMSEIRPLYEAVKQLTRNRNLRDKIVDRLFEETPILREAYFDYEYMQMLIAIRDHFWRENLTPKRQYLHKHGFVHELSRSGFADEMYTALASLDPFHRGFNYEENRCVTRSRTSSSGLHSSDTRSAIGYTPSPAANQLVNGITERLKQLSAGNNATTSLIFLGNRVD